MRRPHVSDLSAGRTRTRRRRVPNQPAEGQVHLTLYLPKELRDRVKARAAERGESLSTAVRRALEEYAREKL